MGRPSTTPPELVAEYMREEEALLFTNQDVADEFDVSTETARIRLKTLTEEGVAREQRAGRATVYYLAALEQYEPLPRLLEQHGEGKVGELLQLIDEHGADTVRETVEIVDEHPGLDEEDYRVLRTTASALADGREREEVVRALEQPRVPPRGERAGFQIGVVMALAGGLGLIYGTAHIVGPVSLPAWGVALTAGVAGAMVGTLLAVVAVIVYNARVVGRTLDTPPLLPSNSAPDQTTDDRR
jgi:hypothetical protein